MTGLQNAAKWYSVKITLVFHAHYTKKHPSIASIGKGETRKEVKEEGEGSFSPSQATQRISLCVSVGYLFRIMISDISENIKGICKPKTKSKMVLENDSL